MEEYYEHLLRMHQKWGFWQITAETTGAQKTIANDLKINYIRPNGLALTIKDYNPSRYEGAKAERIDTVLRPRYMNGQMWHQLGGNWQILEEELMLVRPPHDDLKDCLTTAVASCVPPSNLSMHNFNHYKLNDISHRRFGGVA
jgi:hypothetical protein